LDIAAGGRYTKEVKRYTFERTSPTGGPAFFLGSLSGLTSEYSGTKVDYRADVDYKWTPNFMTYIEYSTGFKGGGINPRPFSPAQVSPFDKETIDAAEIGFKSSLFDNHMRLNASAFFNKYDNIQLTLLACPNSPCAKPVNAGDAHVKGAELETEIHPFAGLSLDASASYLDFVYTNVLPTTGITLGMVTPYTPKTKFSAGVQYEIGVPGAGALTPRIDASYQNAIFTNAVNAPSNHIGGYTLTNARLGWKSEDGTWQASAQLTNLTGKLYYLTLLDFSTIAGYANGQPGPPREWALTVKRNF
jgi:iron complex outermembrane recepter protein